MDTTISKTSVQFLHNTEFIYDYTDLAPKFFSRQMNISIQILTNLFEIWIDAIQSIIYQDFKKHDALVGENACHIRAVALIDIYFKIQGDYEFQIIIEELLEKIRTLIKECRVLALQEGDEKITIFQYLYKNDLLFYMPENGFNDIKFIIDSHLLTITKETLPVIGFTLNEKTNYHFLNRWGFAKNKAKNMVSCAQKSLSHASCEYIKQESCYLGVKSFKYLLNVKYDAHERSFMPQFIVSKVLFQRVLHKNYKITVKINRYLKGSLIDQLSLYFKPNSLQTDFELCNAICYKDPCIVLSGVVNYFSEIESQEQYISRLLSNSFLDVVYANFASHPQYSGELKNMEIPFNDLIFAIRSELDNIESATTNEKILELTSTIHQIEQEFTDFKNKKNFAFRHGCCIDNSSLLFLNHIYADIPENYSYTKMPTMQKERLAV